MLQLAGVKPENRLREQYHNTVNCDNCRHCNQNRHHHDRHHLPRRHRHRVLLCLQGSRSQGPGTIYSVEPVGRPLRPRKNWHLLARSDDDDDDEDQNDDNVSICS